MQNLQKLKRETKVKNPTHAKSTNNCQQSRYIVWQLNHTCYMRLQFPVTNATTQAQQANHSTDCCCTQTHVTLVTTHCSHFSCYDAEATW